MAPHDFSSLLHHQPELSHSLVPSQEVFSYLKNPRLSEDLNILENNYLEDGKIKLFDDVIDVQSHLTPVNPEIRTLGKLETGSLPSFAETKALGPKYQEFEATSQYHDIKIFNEGLRDAYCSYGEVDDSYQMNGLTFFGKKLFEDTQEIVKEEKTEVFGEWEGPYFDEDDNDYTYMNCVIGK